MSDEWRPPVRRAEDANPHVADDARGTAPRAAPGTTGAAGKFGTLVGLHPLVAVALFAVDMMLFGEEAATAGVGVALTIPAGLALAVPAYLLQRHAYGDSRAVALGKALMVGVLTAIPTPLPSALTLAGGVFGFFDLRARGELRRAGG